MDGPGVDLFHPQLGDDVVLMDGPGDVVVVLLQLRLGQTAATAGRRQDAVAVVSRRRDTGQSATDSLVTRPQQTPDVVEVLVVMT